MKKDKIKNGNLVEHNQSDCKLCPGEVVEETGVYEICHADEPRITVVLLKNTLFPYCKQCKDSVRYKLIQAAPHISEDPDFQEDPPEPDNPKSEAAVPTNTFPLQLGIRHGFRFWQENVPAWGEGPEGGNL